MATHFNNGDANGAIRTILNANADELTVATAAIAAETTARTSGDASNATSTATNTASIAAETTNRIAGDASTLVSARAYSDNNTLQATETVKGTSKIATQAIIETVGSTNDTDVVTAKKFWQGFAKGLISVALLGTPTAPTAAVGTNTAQIATCAFVLANVGSGGSGVAGLTSVAGQLAYQMAASTNTLFALKGLSTGNAVTPGAATNAYSLQGFQSDGITQSYFISDRGEISAKDSFWIGANKFIHTSGIAFNNDNIFMGRGAGNTTGTAGANMGFGGLAGASLTTGNSNNIFGELAGYLLADGSTNCLFGSAAGRNLTSGSQNVIVGNRPGDTLSTGGKNCIIGGGDTSCYDTIARSNVGIGFNAGLGNGIGFANTYLGMYCGQVGGPFNNVITAGHEAYATKSSQCVIGSSYLPISEFVWGGDDVDASGTIGVKDTPTTILFKGFNTVGTDRAGNSLRILPGYSRGAGGGGDFTVSTTNTGATGTALNTYTDRIIVKGGTGYVGIGITPTTALHVAGQLRLVDGTQAAGKYLSCDVNGVASWSTVSAGSVSWGSVIGTLSSQTDLQNALNAKQNTITGLYFSSTQLASQTTAATNTLVTLKGLSAGAAAFAPGTATNAYNIQGFQSNGTTQSFFLSDKGEVGATDSFWLNGAKYIHYGPTYSLGNFFAGRAAGNATMTGGANTGFGGVLTGLTTGIQNTVLADSAGNGITTGSGNTLFGSSSGGSISTATGNTLVGFSTLPSNNSNYNTAIGYQAAINVSGTGNENIYLGYQTGSAVVAGNRNIMIGSFAGQAGAGTFTTSAVIGALGDFTKSNQLVLGSSDGPSRYLEILLGQSNRQSSYDRTPTTILVATGSNFSTTSNTDLIGTHMRYAAGQSFGAGNPGNFIISVGTRGATGLVLNTAYLDALTVTGGTGKVTINTGKFNINTIPTTNTGLVAGDIWSNAGVLTIV